ncbi:MAG: hypothetical protein ACI9J3_001384 [Parvicellaceae bacterium]|jgi:hypothetical protein
MTEDAITWRAERKKNDFVNHFSERASLPRWASHELAKQRSQHRS